MQEREYVELRSEDVQEILGTPPGWLVRWGTTVVLLGFGVMIATAWFLRYPDVVKAPVEITTSVPPADVVARADGRITKVVATDRMVVKEGEILAVMQSAANYADVLELDMSARAWQTSKIDSLKLITPVRNYQLGELQSTYADFLADLDAYQFGKTSRNSNAQSNINAIAMQIKQLEQSIVFDQKALKRTSDQLKSAEELYQKQKQLYEDGITSRTEFERERTKLADFERLRDQYEDNVLRKRNEIIALRSGINTASFGQQETASSTATQLLNSLRTLQSAIESWKQNYLLAAPIDGRVSLQIQGAQQYVKQGETVITVVPEKGDKIIGRGALKPEGSGKVKAGQKVLLKLDSYPYYEFGALEGEIVSKSLVPKDNTYQILLSVSVTDQNELRTNYGKKIPFEQKLRGTAEIITEDKAFLERITDQVFARLK